MVVKRNTERAIFIVKNEHLPTPLTLASMTYCIIEMAGEIQPSLSMYFRKRLTILT